MSFTDSDRMNVFPKPNPFLIPEILENILLHQCQSLWNYQDLRNMRLVCRLWNDVTLSLWRSTATICLLQERRPTSRKKGILATKYVKFLQDEENVFQLQQKPFFKYKLFNWKFQGSYRDFQKLWNIFGNLVKELTLERCNFHDSYPELLRNILYVGSPNLTRLILDSSNCESRFTSLICSAIQTSRHPNIEYLEVRKMMPFKTETKRFFIIFLRTFPGLKTLKMEDIGPELFVHWNSRNVPTELIDKIGEENFFLEEALRWYHLSNLKTLDLMHWNLSPVSFTNLFCPLKRLQLPLESLSISLSCVAQEDEEFRNLVKTHVNTLRVLKVFVAPFYRPHDSWRWNSFSEDEPSSIEELELWGNVVNDFDFLFGMPELKKLRMNYDCFEKRKYIMETYSKEAVQNVASYDIIRGTFLCRPFWNYSIVMEHLTEFHIDRLFGEVEIRLFAKWMPNLRSFKSIFISSTFWMVLHEWRDRNCLEELHALYGSDLEDKAICGYPCEDREYPNITWLKGLRHFSLETYCDVGQLTDRAAEDGFLKANLSSLKISVSSCFSPEMEERLKQRIRQVKVVRNYGDHEGECCERLNWKKKALVPGKDVLVLDTQFYHLLRREDLVEAGSLMQ